MGFLQEVYLKKYRIKCLSLFRQPLLTRLCHGGGNKAYITKGERKKVDE